MKTPIHTRARVNPGPDGTVQYHPKSHERPTVTVPRGEAAQMLRSADLRQAFIQSVELRGADLSDLDLSGSTFFRCGLDGADMSKCNLTNVVFSQCSTANLDLTDAEVAGLMAKRCSHRLDLPKTQAALQAVTDE
ncbi:MAG TPA: pentapeptide repeat-containing protein [Sedimenticola thiotaurini]|uniref:Pentapeptide repeat-containing protein n=1 Tax=Sedimenticola thiotaurini TaxID=1543721 RepID=A0A831RJY2_9GAMM|nr:pentapeptide repeat-containing protein [Sedimenticola thiotaurini]